jgi:hypothetical protein
MKDSIASGETTLVNPVNAKHSLNEAAAVVEEERIEGMLMDEEEHLMDHDEEITSEEETEEHVEAEERKMLTVALVNSVVETTQDGENRYGLRKRRRPAGEDLRVLEHNQSSKDGGLARSARMETDDEIDPAEPTDPGLVEANASAMESSESVDIAKPGAVEGKVEAQPPRPPPGQLKRPAAFPAPAPAPAPKLEPSLSSITVLPSSSSVPNPLGALPIPASTISLHSSKAAHASSVTATVPCPLPGASAVKTEVPDTSEKRKVTINEPAYRSRGFSIDLESVGFDFGEESSGQTELPAGGRNRAFSFECFAFGINADEPLPPLASHETDSLSMGRPRGDSIIFDPTSFQDGGIHEQSALEKARLAPSADNRKEKAAPSVADAAVSQRGTSATKAGVPAAVTSYTTTTTTATSTTTTTTVIPSPSTTTTNGTFSMDLLNKEGRIGIYLPAARKERIARFHEKRARRIWRKRIKYDCRKKLADSRPRIKGRFVKRSDMDEGET